MSAFAELLAALPAPPEYSYDWTALGSSPVGRYFDDLAATPQEARWHGEGDVLAHTKLVCETLADMDAFRALPEKRRCAVALAALLHDIGKAKCTRFENGAWTSPNHSTTGAHMARELLWTEFGLCGTPESIAFRETVCLLIRYHMTPVHLLQQRDYERRIHKIASNSLLAEYFDMELLCLLSEADVLGRVSEDREESHETVQLCAAAAEELGCLRGVPEWDDYSRRRYLAGAPIYPGQQLYDENWGEVILLSGLPGTGKDTWIAENCPELPVVSLDDIRLELGIAPTERQERVINTATERAKALLRQKRPFVWNATNLSSMVRGRQVKLFEDYHAAVRIVYLETRWDEMLRRNASRAARVPEAVIGNMLSTLSLPERFEAQWVEWRCV